MDNHVTGIGRGNGDIKKWAPVVLAGAVVVPGSPNAQTLDAKATG
jgi:hypothetical protein